MKVQGKNLLSWVKRYSITFRYATGSTATRTIELDGTVVVSKFSFPSTGGYVHLL